MFDIGETVRQGVARAAERGVTFVTVHGDGEIMKAAVEGKGNSRLKIFAITVLTSVDQDGLRELGYLCSVEELIRLRVKRAIECGCDGIIASPHDNPNRIRELAGEQRLLIATPGVRLAGSSPMITSGPAHPRRRSRQGRIISSSAARSSEATTRPRRDGDHREHAEHVVGEVPEVAGASFVMNSPLLCTILVEKAVERSAQ